MTEPKDFPERTPELIAREQEIFDYLSHSLSLTVEVTDGTGNYGYESAGVTVSLFLHNPTTEKSELIAREFG